MNTRAVYTSLRTRADFSRAHSQGRRKANGRIQLRVTPSPDTPNVEPTIRLGIVVSRKYGNAVQRNRFKRLVRTALRDLRPELTPGWDILVLPREARQATMQEMRESLHTLLSALGVLRTEETGGLSEGEA